NRPAGPHKSFTQRRLGRHGCKTAGLICENSLFKQPQTFYDVCGCFWAMGLDLDQLLCYLL
ncbi:MAG: hypothetical protein RSF00_09235, partial [Oscillospiraceae bacterium]